MRNQDFERYFKTFIQRAAQKSVRFKSVKTVNEDGTYTTHQGLTKDEQIDYLLSVLNVDIENTLVTTEKEVEISKLSKDVRFELIQKAAIDGNLESVQNLSLGQGTTKLVVSVPFGKATQSAQLNFLTEKHINEIGSLPEYVTIDILGGENFKAFIDFCYNEIHK